jgi:predicted flap endonuclease-1-like 5' DNA nuclease
MEKEIISVVQSPARDHHLRTGDGFSLVEIEKSDKTIQQLKDLGVRIDYRRQSAHEINIETLNQLEVPEKKEKKRTPFVKKEKKRTPFIPLEERKKEKQPEEVEEKIEKKPEKKKIEKKPKEVKKSKEKPKKTPKEKAIPLTKLHRLGPKTEEKFKEIGINSVNDLVKENPDEIGTLIDGCSEDSVRSWIEEGKKLLE